MPEIVRVPGRCAGQPIIRGLRIRVTDIVQWLQWYTPEQIVHNFPDLTLADVEAARQYYQQNKAELDAYIQADLDAEREVANA